MMKYVLSVLLLMDIGMTVSHFYIVTGENNLVGTYGMMMMSHLLIALFIFIFSIFNVSRDYLKKNGFAFLGMLLSFYSFKEYIDNTDAPEFKIISVILVFLLLVQIIQWWNFSNKQSDQRNKKSRARTP